MTQDLARKARVEGERILAYWNSRVLLPGGDFYGRVTPDGPDAEAEKSLVLASRLLWTFAHAQRAGLGETERQARDLFDGLGRFWDSRHGGFFWSLDGNGQPLQTFKHVYGQSFALYALAEYYALHPTPWALSLAETTFWILERVAWDLDHFGFFEAFEEDWRPRTLPSPINGPAPKSMNTHLHLLESFTALWRVWPHPVLRERLASLYELLTTRIYDSASRHFHQFFAADWTPLGTPRASYGHDIEGSWLITETAEALGDADRIERAHRTAVAMAEAVLTEGRDDQGAVVNEGIDGRVTDANKDWWPQAEGLVGFANAYRLSGDLRYLEALERLWDFVERAFIDRDGGEWFGKTDAAGHPRRDLPQVSFWKCPYHNFRAMAELTRRLGE